ncbi:MAG: hypothetical protein U5K54_00190 [Cytophagales bacterium]|nr:hypothetical protein [Cytophagales bacterium]
MFATIKPNKNYTNHETGSKRKIDEQKIVFVSDFSPHFSKQPAICARRSAGRREIRAEYEHGPGSGKLEALGYEICGVKPMKHTEDWINQSAKTCITLTFDKKTQKITNITPNADYSGCLQGLEKVRKIWENYHDGQAPVSDAKIDSERKKLSDQGFKVSYYTVDISPGRSAEHWVNESTKKVKLIVWETQSNKWVMTNDSDYSSAKNPSPIKK